MTVLDEWLKICYSSQGDEGPASLSAAQRQQLQQIIEELIKQLEVDDVQLEDLSKFCQLIDGIITESQSNPRLGQGFWILDGFLTTLLDFSMYIAATNREVHRTLREDTSLLSTLTSSLRKYRKEDQSKILMYIEVLSRELSLCWTAPYVTMLFRQMFSLLLATGPSSDVFLYGLRIVNNVTFHNRNCLNIAMRDAKYKDMMKKLMVVLQETDSPKEISSLAMHLVLTMDQAVSLKMENLINNIKETFLNLHLKFSSGTISNENLHSIIGTIHHMGLCLRSVLTQIFKICREQAESESENSNEENRRLVTALQQTLTIIFQTFFTKCVPLLGTARGQLILESLLRILVAFCPNNMPNWICDKLWNCFIKALNDVCNVASKRSKTQVVVLETHLHLVGRLLNASSSVHKKVTAESFTAALKTCQLVISTAADDVTRNILTIRLVHKLNSLASSQCKKETNMFPKVTADEVLFQLLDKMLLQPTEDGQFPNIKLSTCVIEVLNVVSKHSKSPTALMENLEKETTWVHIANCIVNGDEELIGLAFSLMGAVGISNKCRNGVSKIISSLRDVAQPPPPKSLLASPDKQSFPSYSAQLGMVKLNHNLELFGQINQEGSSPEFDDVLTWYQLKSEMYEMELTSMNDHIFHLNRTISHLKTLLNKQSLLATKRATSTATMQKSISDLKKQLESTKGIKLQLETKHAKALNGLKLQVEYQESLFKQKTERLTQVEQQFKELKDYCLKLEHSKAEATEASQKLNSEKRKLEEKLEEVEKNFKSSKQKISTLENDLKKSEEGRKQAEMLLEAEKRKTEIIQQVLGNRMN